MQKPAADHPSGHRLQYTLAQPVLGGELGYRVNFTSLTREDGDLRPDHANRRAQRDLCDRSTADPAVKTPTNCLLRGIPGTYTRFSAETNWRRTVIDPIGQIFTPFVSLRGRRRRRSTCRIETGVSNFIATGDSDVVRGMPTAGLEYRYPFISVQSWGTQTIEPIATADRAPERDVDRQDCPNEDAQSLIFDDSNLFRVDKFSGWDRIRRRRTGQCRRAVHRRNSITAASSMCCSVSPTTCSAPTRSRSATRSIPGSTAASTPAAPTTWRGCRLSAGQRLYLHLALPLRRETPSTSAVSSWRAAPITTAGRPAGALRQLRRAARDRLPDPPRGRSGQRVG